MEINAAETKITISNAIGSNLNGEHDITGKKITVKGLTFNISALLN